MDLLLDIGNTRIKWVQRITGRFAEPGELLHARNPAAAAAAVFDQITDQPSRVLAANVAGEPMSRALTHGAQSRWGIVVEFAETEKSAGGVRNGYRDHRQMGVDRWLAIVAAYEQFARSVCVVDAGTAVTIDMVSNDGEHRGGFILPGLDLMRESLRQDTGDIRRLIGRQRGVDSQTPEIPARDTAGAVHSGSLLAITCLIEHCVALLFEASDDACLVVTGGDALRILPMITVPGTHRPQLVLEGLAARLD
jgi:type III pantothenate kinase